jgi:hypothetical protein
MLLRTILNRSLISTFQSLTLCPYAPKQDYDHNCVGGEILIHQHYTKYVPLPIKSGRLRPDFASCYKEFVIEVSKAC